MARPVKWKRVCKMPKIDSYGPLNSSSKENIFMTVEELESIRLMDVEDLDQVKCSKIMKVARSTFQRIYQNARAKVADSIINGKTLKIQGGNYKVCKEKNKRGCICRCSQRKNIEL